MSKDDMEYLAQREADERAAMRLAANPQVAAIHGQLASHYAARQRDAQQKPSRRA